MFKFYNLGKLLGIPIKIHSTTFIFLGIILLVNWINNGLNKSLFLLLDYVMLFTIVTLHELGHSYAALKYKIPVKGILLIPIGGVASIPDIPKDSKKEFVISLAGPLFNFLLCIISAFAYKYFLHFVFIKHFCVLNLAIMVFNLLPVYPMDGGRILRAFISSFKGYLKGTEVTINISYILSGGLALLGIFSGVYQLTIVMLVIGLFAYLEKRELNKKNKQ